MTESDEGGRIVDGLRALVSDAETLLRSTAGGAEISGEAEARLRKLRERLGRLEQQVRDRAHDVDGYVRSHPWHAVAITGGLALLLGVLLGRR